MSDRLYNVLFLCSQNSARSIFAEAILNRAGIGRFRAFSAGSDPAGEVHPMARELLARLNYPVDGLRSKDWGEFRGDEATPMDFVITVCDRIAGETCPPWPGAPVTAHWSITDPAAAPGNDAERRLAFAHAYREINTRVEIFANLPMGSLDSLALGRRIDEIGSDPARSA